MPFQPKKRLLRYALKNCGKIGDGTNPISNKYGYNCESFFADFYDDDEECLQSKRERSRSPVHPSLSSPSSMMTHIATTAANIIRSCCCAATTAVTTATAATATTTAAATATTPNNNNEKGHDRSNGIHCSNSVHLSYEMQQDFETLMKILKRPQICELYLAVKSRIEKLSNLMPKAANCIRIPRSQSSNEEPHVIAYRLFFWEQLKNASQLKRLPHCLIENDPAYECCNPLHYGRIITDISPPPYQRTATEIEDFSQGDHSQEGENSCSKKVKSNTTLSSQDMMPNLRVRIPESQSTDGENYRSDSRTWCKVAYWELTQRVGEFYFAKKPSVNICFGSECCKGQISEEVDLHKFFDARKIPYRVQNIRQKIGLGIVLNEESNGVWLFNRSIEPIFVHSPTLCESWFQVCKVLPGDCLKAFDYQKARELKDPPQLPGAQIGPVDKYSMRISFVKGYGVTYKRQDVTQCPCWLEIHFTKR